MSEPTSATARPRNILIIEDDTAIATGLALNLRLEGFAPTLVSRGDEAMEMIARLRPILVLLDLSLPGRDGLDILSELRLTGDHTPVIVLSAREGEYDKVAALRLGADDYVTKPFALAELMARVAAVLRRTAAAAFEPPAVAPADNGIQPPVCFADVEVDLARRTVHRSGAEVRLTHLEFELLAYLVRHPTEVLSRDRLLREVWGVRGGSPRTVDNFVAQLRGKLESDPDDPRHIVTVRGSGYRWAHPTGR